MSGKLQLYIFIFSFLPCFSYAQKIIREFDPESVDSLELQLLKKQFGRNKSIPVEFEKPILIALSYYPELIDTKINFHLKRKKSPLMAKPGFFSTIIRQPRNRTYHIIISTQPEKYLEHIKFSKLPFNAQIGVVGHELSHVSDFTQRDILGIMAIAFGNLSAKWLDQFENNTDRTTIDHGLGYQLLDWSLAVRKRLHLKTYAGTAEISEEQLKALEESGRERYMNPSTIEDIIKGHPLYMKIYGQESE